jgi:hypothetical protein
VPPLIRFCCKREAGNLAGRNLEWHTCSTVPRERLEQYVLDRIVNAGALAEIEEHLLWCEYCLGCMEEMEQFVKSLKAGTKRGGFDVELMAEEFRTWRTRINEGKDLPKKSYSAARPF